MAFARRASSFVPAHYSKQLGPVDQVEVQEHCRLSAIDSLAGHFQAHQLCQPFLFEAYQLCCCNALMSLSFDSGKSSSGFAASMPAGYKLPVIFNALG